MTTDSLFTKLLDGSLPLGLVTVLLAAWGLRAVAKWCASNYWPQHVKWRDQRMAQEAAAETRQAELIAHAFEQSASLHARASEQAAQHELNDEKRHHVTLDHISRVAGADRHEERNRIMVVVQGNIEHQIEESEKRITREVRRLARESASGDLEPEAVGG